MFYRSLVFIVMAHSANGQVNNPEFEEWDLYNGREKPKEWFCPNLCPSQACGPCDKIEQSDQDYAVRIHNVMPCVSSDNQAKSRNAGFIRDHFIYANSHFRISYDLIIDSIEMPAEFIFTISNFVWKTESIQSTRVEHEIYLTQIPDSIGIQFESKGGLKQNALHDCDFGYLSAIVDDIRVSEIVDVQEVQQPHFLTYPNPFIDKIQIDDEVIVTQWKLFDTNGKLIFHGSANNIEGLENLASGMYVLLINDSERTYLKRIVKY